MRGFEFKEREASGRERDMNMVHGSLLGSLKPVFDNGAYGKGGSQSRCNEEREREGDVDVHVHV